MSALRTRMLAVAESIVAKPMVGDDGIPKCNERCPQYDGKRCELLGHQPQSLCEPTLAITVKRLHVAEHRLERACEQLDARAIELAQRLTAAGSFPQMSASEGHELSEAVLTTAAFIGATK